VKVVPSLQHVRDPGDLRVTTWIMDGRTVTLLNAVRVVWKGSATKRTWDMRGSLHLTMGYLHGWYTTRIKGGLQRFGTCMSNVLGSNL
jgi:hypothetical protein